MPHRWKDGQNQRDWPSESEMLTFSLCSFRQLSKCKSSAALLEVPAWLSWPKWSKDSKWSICSSSSLCQSFSWAGRQEIKMWTNFFLVPKKHILFLQFLQLSNSFLNFHYRLLCVMCTFVYMHSSEQVLPPNFLPLLGFGRCKQEV